ncbi:hypothetical protein QFE97_01785 [Bacillus subtilis]|nr:hypothetical protein QFE97_01785 [Bacillus subtilis]
MITFDDLDIEFRMVRFELFEELWKQERSNGLKTSYDDRPAHFVLTGLNGFHGIRDPTEDLPRLLQQALSCGGEHQPLRVLANEERSAERLLELIDRGRHRRLSDVKLLAGFGHIQRLGALSEIGELSQRD